MEYLFNSGKAQIETNLLFWRLFIEECNFRKIRWTITAILVNDTRLFAHNIMLFVNCVFTRFFLKFLSAHTKMSISKIKAAVESFAPAEEAASWDNTGILIGADENNPNNKILLTIDLTDQVVDEAINGEIGYILAYHPVIFHPIKSITDSRYIKCIKNGMSVYSPHTQLDRLMNEYLKREVGDNPGTIKDVARKLHKLSGSRVFRTVYDEHTSLKKFKNDGDILYGVGATFRNTENLEGLLVTGEMSHHDMLACQRRGIPVILMEHSNSERVFLPALKRMLLDTGMLNEFKIEISKCDEEPVKFMIF